MTVQLGQKCDVGSGSMPRLSVTRMIALRASKTASNRRGATRCRTSLAQHDRLQLIALRPDGADDGGTDVAKPLEFYETGVSPVRGDARQ